MSPYKNPEPEDNPPRCLDCILTWSANKKTLVDYDKQCKNCKFAKHPTPCADECGDIVIWCSRHPSIAHWCSSTIIRKCIYYKEKEVKNEFKGNNRL